MLVVRMFISSLAAAQVLALGAGCYQPRNGSSRIMQRVVDARQLYGDPRFTLDSLRRDGVAPLAARLSMGSETFGPPLTQGLMEVLEERVGAAVVHPNVAINRINEAGLTHDYAGMRADYGDTNILNRYPLEALSEAVKVRYFAVPILVNFSEDLATRFSIFGVRLAKTASANARFQLQIWDGRTGCIVWEGLSDMTLGQDTIREERIRFDDIVRSNWQSLIEQVPAGQPAEPPSP